MVFPSVSSHLNQFSVGDFEYEEVDLMELPPRARKELVGLQEQFEEEAAVLNEDLMSFAGLPRVFWSLKQPKATVL